MTPAQLIALAERVQGAIGPDRELDAAVCDAIGWWPAEYKRKDFYRPDRRWHDWKGSGGNRLSDHVDAPQFTASLDAAMTLVPEGYFVTIIRDPGGIGYAWVADHPDSFGPPCATPALALTAAALRARAGA